MNLFKLLLGAKLVGVSALLFSAILRLGGKTSVALSADSFLAVETLGEKGQRGIVDSSSQSEDQVKGGLLLNVVVAQSSTVF